MTKFEIVIDDQDRHHAPAVPFTLNVYKNDDGEIDPIDDEAIIGADIPTMLRALADKWQTKRDEFEPARFAISNVKPDLPYVIDADGNRGLFLGRLARFGITGTINGPSGDLNFTVTVDMDEDGDLAAFLTLPTVFAETLFFIEDYEDPAGLTHHIEPIGLGLADVVPLAQAIDKAYRAARDEFAATITAAAESFTL